MNLTIALIGNPNSGKTSLFNRITKLNQKVANYGGVTVEIKKGYIYNKKIEIVDLPGIYSIYPNSKDEKISTDILLKKTSDTNNISTILVCEPTNIERSIILYDQLKDLDISCLFVINMKDEIKKKGIQININKLENELNTKIYLTNSINGDGIEKLVEDIISDYKSESEKLNKNKLVNDNISNYKNRFIIPNEYKKIIDIIKNNLNIKSDYEAWVNISYNKEKINHILDEFNIIPKRLQVKEYIRRFDDIKIRLSNLIIYKNNKKNIISDKIDKIILNPISGYVIFFVILFIIFQSVYYGSEPIVEFIENIFKYISDKILTLLPPNYIRDLFIEGILPGLQGLFSFIPQISIIFVYMSILEESGYMSRLIYISDRIMKPLGLNGKSIIPLIAGTACAVPAIMATRNIENYKERLITILVTPFMTCSARIPIYVIITSLLCPNKNIGIFKLHGIILMCLYILGIIGVIISGVILKAIIKKNNNDTGIIIEIPPYKVPNYKNIIIDVIYKIKTFIEGTWKIILSISIILWCLGSYKLSNNMKLNSFLEKTELNNSLLSKTSIVLNPIFSPLGYDWKIGVGLITSLAAREVFVSTMATLYNMKEEFNIDNDESKNNLIEKMRNDINPVTKKNTYNLATSISLLIFYTFSMQCISTIAVVKKETKSWKWAIIQFIFMTSVAYLLSYIFYSILK